MSSFWFIYNVVIRNTVYFHCEFFRESNIFIENYNVNIDIIVWKSPKDS